LSKRVLVADDEPNIVAALEFVLRRAGYDVTAAANALEFLLRRSGYQVAIARDGVEALALAPSSDLVLLDVMMPLRSGYEVCRELRRQPEGGRVRIIMLSAKGGQADIERGLEAGADAYVTKPFGNRELLDRIGALLAR
jgi:two-component system alkaline phosphatase synthesis response regulator PhoP